MTPRADYGAARTGRTGPGGLIASVEAGSPAQRAGLTAGDVLTMADGSALRDVIDWRWEADGPAVAVRGFRSGGASFEATLVREPGEPWGIDFADPLFDAIRTCANRCSFCFMSQLPQGLRRALYVRDDDFRLSFLQGNFVTLTNLDDADVDRIAEQHLSPLYVSVHAVDADVRSRLICAREDRALERIDSITESGIDLHVQIVLVPAVNDGEVLERTLTWLAEREGIMSAGVVPLGFTAHQAVFADSFEDPVNARVVLDQLGAWQDACRERYGVPWVYAADEFYLNAHRPVPAAEAYGGFPQYENGIGLVRVFVDELASHVEHIDEAVALLRRSGRHAVLVTGELFAPVLSAWLGDTGRGDVVEVLPVANRFFGGNVSVTGLLTAADIIETIGPADAASPGPCVYIVPDVIANADGLTLDDVPANDLGRRTGRDIRLVSCDADGLAEGLLSAAVEMDARDYQKSR